MGPGRQRCENGFGVVRSDNCNADSGDRSVTDRNKGFETTPATAVQFRTRVDGDLRIAESLPEGVILCWEPRPPSIRVTETPRLGMISMQPHNISHVAAC